MPDEPFDTHSWQTRNVTVVLNEGTTLILGKYFSVERSNSTGEDRYSLSVADPNHRTPLGDLTYDQAAALFDGRLWTALHEEQ